MRKSFTEKVADISSRELRSNKSSIDGSRDTPKAPIEDSSGCVYYIQPHNFSHFHVINMVVEEAGLFDVVLPWDSFVPDRACRSCLEREWPKDAHLTKMDINFEDLGTDDLTTENIEMMEILDFEWKILDKAERIGMFESIFEEILGQGRNDSSMFASIQKSSGKRSSVQKSDSGVSASIRSPCFRVQRVSE